MSKLPHHKVFELAAPAPHFNIDVLPSKLRTVRFRIPQGIYEFAFNKRGDHRDVVLNSVEEGEEMNHENPVFQQMVRRAAAILRQREENAEIPHNQIVGPKSSSDTARPAQKEEQLDLF